MTVDEKLDEALKQTFPASDAFSLLPELSGPDPDQGSRHASPISSQSRCSPTQGLP